MGYRAHLANRLRPCSSAIAAVAERLLLTCTSPPISRSITGQSLECGGERRLGSVAKRNGDGHDRHVGVAQHLHGLLEPVLAQPRMGREPGAFLEGATEMEARQACF